MPSVDSTSTYTSWQDLVNTLSAIITREAEKMEDNTEINMPDVVTARNPGDHFDHYLAGVLALSATKNNCYHNILYTGYNVSHMPPQLTPAEINFKQELLKCIGMELGPDGYPDCQDNWHKSFTQNEYSIAETNGCSFPDSGVFYVRKFGVRQEDDENDEGDLSYTLYPNPATAVLHLSVSDRQRSVSGIRVLDMYGNTKKKFEVSAVGYAWEIPLPVDDLPAGVYFLEVVSGGRRNLFRFSKL